MADVLPSDYIMGIIIFTAFIVGGVALIGEFSGYKGDFVDDEKFATFNDTLNTYNDIDSEVSGLKSNIVDADTDFGVFGVLNSLIASAWQSLRLLFSSFGFMDAVFEGVHDLFGVPKWVSGLASLLITVLIAFAIYSAVFQTKV